VARGGLRIEHLLRRAGFGASLDELTFYSELGYQATLERLLDFESIPDTVDSRIGEPGYVGVTSRGPLQPTTVINDARQRWLFRMVHTDRPLQEKMALYWHHHFATAFTKINNLNGSAEATRMLAAKPSEDPGRVRGQLELFRQFALGNFRDLLVEVARDPAMLVWLDGRVNFRNRPQENFARELMELFSMGVGFFREEDVYAGARAFTGWNLRRGGNAADGSARNEFFYNPNQHDTSAKTFSFPIYADGSSTMPARSAAAGLQDGLDLIEAVARHPETPRRLARRLYAFFVSEIDEPSESFLSSVSSVYFETGYNMRAVVRAVLQSPDFHDSAHMYARYAWPVEFVVRALKETGWVGFSLNDALTPLTNMGQQLFEPPDVNGWDVGRGWFSTGGMLARMNFAATLATNQRLNLRNDARIANASPQALMAWALDRVSPAPYDSAPYADLMTYVTANLPRWTGSDQDLLVKTSGLVHLLLGSAEYQFV
jgi:uncharacterized protein (DUF1800 family)